MCADTRPERRDARARRADRPLRSRWFRAVGSDDAPGTALVTLSGAVARRAVYEIELGSSLADLVGRAGGARERNLSLSRRRLLRQVGSRGHRGAAAAHARNPRRGRHRRVPAHACALAECARVVRYLAAESAGQCGPCVHGLAAIAGALARLAGGAAADRQAEAQIRRWAEQMRPRSLSPPRRRGRVRTERAHGVHQGGRAARPPRLVPSPPAGGAPPSDRGNAVSRESPAPAWTRSRATVMASAPSFSPNVWSSTTGGSRSSIPSRSSRRSSSTLDVPSPHAQAPLPLVRTPRTA